MSRIIGFLLGLTLVLALAIAAVRFSVTEMFFGDQRDVPAPPASNSVERHEGEDLETLPRAEPAAPASLTIDDNGDASTVPATKPPAQDASPGVGQISERPPVGASQNESGDRLERDLSDGSVGAERQWFAFWQPFHSEISAEGFRSRLEHLTGLDYRIVSPRPGEYQVGFAYADEAQRQQYLAAIEAATGLSLRSNAL